MKRDYFRAAEDTLTAIDVDEGAGEKRDSRNSPILRDWPLKFRNISILYAPKNSCLLAAYSGLKSTALFAGNWRRLRRCC
jgi:hypothetical protein